MVKNLCAMRKTLANFLEAEMTNDFNILAWRIPWTGEPGRLQSCGLKESDTTEQLSVSLFTSSGDV